MSFADGAIVAMIVVALIVFGATLRWLSGALSSPRGFYRRRFVEARPPRSPGSGDGSLSRSEG